MSKGGRVTDSCSGNHGVGGLVQSGVKLKIGGANYGHHPTRDKGSRLPGSGVQVRKQDTSFFPFPRRFLCLNPGE